MPVIRIDDEVWSWLQGLAEPFTDTPNSVLRQLAGLDVLTTRIGGSEEGGIEGYPMTRRAKSPIKTGFGRDLNERWGVRAEHALYREDGTWYEHLQRFPGALFDAKGYVLFRSEREYLENPALHHGKQLTVRRGISSMPEYIRVIKPN